MKKSIKLISIFILALMINISVVKAANYSERELIPTNVTTSVFTNNLSYKEIYFDKENSIIKFKGIKNVSEDKLPISVTIGLFNDKRLNIGTISYCNKEEILKVNEEKEFYIEINKTDLGDKYNLEDVRYLSIIDDNIYCVKIDKNEYLGKEVEKLGKIDDSFFAKNHDIIEKFIYIVLVIFILYMLYLYLFTSRFRNVDGKEVRDGFEMINKELKRERKKDEKLNPKPVYQRKETKSEEVLKQEEKEKENENKETSDLHDFYK